MLTYMQQKLLLIFFHYFLHFTDQMIEGNPWILNIKVCLQVLVSTSAYVEKSCTRPWRIQRKLQV